MPVWVPSIDNADWEDGLHVVMTHSSHLKWLCDWIAVPGWHGIYSLGDILLSLGDWGVPLAMAVVVWEWWKLRKLTKHA